MRGLHGLPGPTGCSEKAPQMLEVMGIGNARVGGVVPGGKVLEKRGHHGDGGARVVDQGDCKAPIGSSLSVNGHTDFSLSMGRIDRIHLCGDRGQRDAEAAWEREACTRARQWRGAPRPCREKVLHQPPPGESIPQVSI